ncbi:MAG: hypothetical protein EXQ95_06365 [Alphaproteobacteria bacterium]|nr:hypothetical protein [Alphaproteobacteria bacterium]
MTARPNLLFLWSDQHAQSVAGCYGDAVAETPNLDRLAAGGITFDGTYCPSPICLPSRMSLLTARHPYAQSCWTNQDILPSGIPTMAHSLGSVGVRATLLGRMHSLGPDQLRGFAQREVGDHSTNWIGGRTHDLGVLDKANDPFRESVRNSGPGQCSYELHDHDVTQAACDHLAELGRRRAAGDKAPFAAVVGWLLPHPPYVCQPGFFDRFKDKVAPPHIPVPSNEHPYLRWWREDRGIADVTLEEAMRARAAYYGLVATLDGMIGRILETLEHAGLAEDTIVVYTTDHGDHLGNRGLWWKSTMYDESARIPLVIRWPGRLTGGATATADPQLDRSDGNAAASAGGAGHSL